MDKGESRFHNPNYPDLTPIQPRNNGETGLFAFDASERLYRKLQLAEKALEDSAEAIHDSMIDPMTGLYNRRYYEHYQATEFDLDTPSNKVGLIFLDIDNLKAFNDSPGGHDAGDEAIMSVAEYFQQNIRSNTDVVMRFGGDEFLLLCYNSHDTEDFEGHLCGFVAERLSDGAPVEFSYGCAVYDSRIDDSLDATKHRADLRMYERKATKKAR